MNSLYFIIEQTILLSIPILIVSLAAMITEKSGVMNIALEGFMIIGALSGLIFIHLLQKNNIFVNQYLLILSFLISIIFGFLFSLIYAYFVIELKSNQIIAGTAINIFATAFSIFVSRSIIGVQQINFSNTFMIKSMKFFSNIPFIGKIFFQNFYLSTYISLLIFIILNFILYKSSFGLRLRAVGENPYAAQISGVNVKKIRYIAIIISGLLASFGGLIYILPITVNFVGDVAGYGFLSLAVVIFGKWKPINILFCSFLFGFFNSISYSYSGIKFFYDYFLIPQFFFQILPYIFTIIILIFSSKKKSFSPKYLGKKI